MRRTCLGDAPHACAGEVDADAPISLCEHHLLVAAEWSNRAYGLVDALPGPCRLCGSRLGVRYPSGWLCAVCEWRFGEVPDGDVPPPRVDVVYYLGWGGLGSGGGARVKIGTTTNPEQRFLAVPHDVVLAFERGGRDLEQRRHAQFAEHRIPRSEWFLANDALAEHVAQLAAGVADPWHLLARWRSEAVALRG